MSDTDLIDEIPAVGDLVAGKFRVVGILGEGGMGIVLDAIHEQLRTPVAIKLLRGFTKSPVVLARFLREARAAAGLQSDHVVKVFDVGTLESGAPFMVLERLKGEDLAEVLTREGPQSVADVADYVLQACEGLAEAHAMGIVHRDLKPANLFRVMRKDGSRVVKILDFGISKDAAAVDASLTATAQAMGSPYYMSPEQVRSAKDVDLRTDVWALGIIIHELLTQKAPFGGDTLGSVFAAIVADAPESVRVSRTDVSPALEQVIARCLEKQVARRYANVGELARDLAPFAPRGAEALPRIFRLIPETLRSVDVLASTASQPDLSIPSTVAFSASPPSAAMRTTGGVPDAAPSVAIGSPAGLASSEQATGGAWGATRPSNTSAASSSRRRVVFSAVGAALVLAVAMIAWLGLRGAVPTAAAPPVAATQTAAAAPGETAPPPPPSVAVQTAAPSSAVAPPLSPGEAASKPASSAPVSGKTAKPHTAPHTQATASPKSPSNEAYDDRQ